jgi:hypothetical protein
MVYREIHMDVATEFIVIGDLIGSSEAQEDGIVGETPMPRPAPPRFPTVRFTYTSSLQYSLTSYLRTSSTQVVSSPCRGISRL